MQNNDELKLTLATHSTTGDGLGSNSSEIDKVMAVKR